MCLNDIWAEEIPRTSSLYIAVNEGTTTTTKKRLILIVNVLMLLQYPHLPNLNAASSVVWQNEKKKKSTLTSDESEPPLRLSVGHILVMI